MFFNVIILLDLKKILMIIFKNKIIPSLLKN